jgi:glycosyltransferase involved in cell wall biosynthesis
MMHKKRIMISVNSSWNIINFRTGIIRALRAKDYELIVVAPRDEYSGRIRDLGCRYVHVDIDCHGKSPIRDFLLLCQFYKILYQERPHLYLGYTAKPNIFGSLAAHALGIPVINNIAGLGAAFSQKKWLSNIVKQLYRLAVSRSDKVFFQNSVDLQLFIEERLVCASRCELLPGSGVDLQMFQPSGERDQNADGKRMRFLLVARLLWDKGVGEYVEAARLIKREFPKVEFQLLGPIDKTNPGAIPRSSLDKWIAEGAIQYLGSVDDVRPVIRTADCVVLPTYYREGTPRSLLEAAAMGKPIVATDWVGCRDVVENGCNGYLCQTRDVEDLSRKMRQMIELSPAARGAMGSFSRDKIAREFDEQIVIKRYENAVHQALATGNAVGGRGYFGERSL